MAKKPLLPGDVAKLRPGKTTRPEIVKIYGKPQNEGLADKDINICYLYVEAGRAQILFLKFDVRDLLVEAALDNLQAKSACGDLIPEGHVIRLPATPTEPRESSSVTTAIEVLSGASSA